MPIFKVLNILSILLALTGIGYQLYTDAYIKNGNDHGTLIVIVSLFLYVISRFLKSKQSNNDT